MANFTKYNDTFAKEAITKANPKALDPNAKKDLLTLTIERNPCTLCRAMRLPLCKGHGSGGGGGGGEESTAAKDDAPDYFNVSPDNTHLTREEIELFSNLFADTNYWQNELISARGLTYQGGLFTVESDKVRGNLIFQVLAGLSGQDLQDAKAFLQAVKSEFEKFKKACAEEVSVTNFSATFNKDETQLSVHIPHPTYFEKFVKHLAKYNLLPTPISGRLLDEDKERPNTKPKYLNPFSTKLSP